MSYNKWEYVYSNPVNYTDPTGWDATIPCREDQSKNDGPRYCILDNDPYKGTYIDMGHFGAGKDMAKAIEKELSKRSRFGKENDPLKVGQSIGPGMELSMDYRTSIPVNGPVDGLQGKKLKQAAFGIFIDYQLRFEWLQGYDPRCHSWILNKIFPHCSSFSNEDLVSDYLGFASKMKPIEFDAIIGALGGGHAEDDSPDGFHPNNYRFNSFALDDCGNFLGVQQPLPSSLFLDYPPMEAGEYWDVPDGTMRIEDLNGRL